jgi:lysozyme
MPNAMVIDLSHHNANVDFPRIRAAGVVGVIHKATQGTKFVDPRYAERKQPAWDAGLMWGAYHFGTGDDVDAQIANFINATHPDGTFVIVLDFEKNGPIGDNSMSLDQAKDFLTKVEAQTGQRPVLYTGHYLTDVAGTKPDPDLASYRVWWARYSSDPHLHATWPNYWLWQYSDGKDGPDHKLVDGASPCDCNTFAGSEDELRANWVLG